MPTEEVTNPPSPQMQRSGARPFPVRNSIAAFVWVVVLVPFVVTVLANGPAGGLIPHGIYHLVYVVIVCTAVYALLQWRSRTTSRIAQRLMLFTAALQGFAVVGHIGEWASTLSDEQYNEPGVGLVKGNEALHTTFANVTVPALVLSILFVVATTLVASRAVRHVS